MGVIKRKTVPKGQVRPNKEIEYVSMMGREKQHEPDPYEKLEKRFQNTY